MNWTPQLALAHADSNRSSRVMRCSCGTSIGNHRESLPLQVEVRSLVLAEAFSLTSGASGLRLSTWSIAKNSHRASPQHAHLFAIVCEVLGISRLFVVHSVSVILPGMLFTPLRGVGLHLLLILFCHSLTSALILLFVRCDIFSLRSRIRLYFSLVICFLLGDN